MDDIISRFLSVGVLSGIKLNSEKAVILDMFPEPDDVLESGSLELYKYKDLEITFQHGHVVIINIEVTGDQVDFPDEIPVSNLFFGPSIEEITADLDHAEIGWHICTESSYDQDLALVTEAGVLVFYGLPEVGLGKIQLSGLTPNYYRYQV